MTTEMRPPPLALICPTCPSLASKIFLFSRSANQRYGPLIPLHQRGASRSSRVLARDAMDARAQLTNAARADGEVAWSRCPDAGINPRVKSPGGRRLSSPALRGERV